MIRKSIDASILAGLLYWGLIRIAPKLDNSTYDFLIAIFLYDIMPIFTGALLLFFLRANKYTAIIYCPIAIIINYFIIFVQLLIVLPSPYNPLMETWNLFKIVGIYSAFFSILGGLMGIYSIRLLGRKKEGKENGKENGKGDRLL